MRPIVLASALTVALLAAAGPALAQTDQSGQTAVPQTAAPQPDTVQPAAPEPGTPADASGAPAPLVVLFDVGSSQIRPEDQKVLDQASRAYAAGKPLVMIVTGSTDSVGRPAANLTLSQRRAAVVLRALLDRGIPAERFQILAKGQTEPAVSTGEGVSEPRNRRVEITWR